MKHIRNIFLPIILLLFSVSIAHSQNEKLWEFDDVGRNVYDLDFYTDTSFIYVGDINGSYDFIIRDLETTELIDSIHIERVNEFEIRDNEIICTGLKSIIIYDKYTFEQKSRFELPPYPYEDYDPSTTFIHKMDVSIDGAKICVIQEHIMFGFPPGVKILVFDLKTEEIQFEYNDKRLFRDVQFSPDGRYFTYSEDKWPAKVRFFDAQTYEHEFDLESRNDDDEDNFLDFYVFSPTGRYIIVRVNGANDRYIGMDLFEESIYLNITKDDKVVFKRQIYFLGDDFLITRPPVVGVTPDAIVYRNRTFDSTFYFQPIVGLDNLSYADNKILSNDGSIFTLFNFDPDILSIETENDTVEVYPQPSSGVFNISLDENYLNKPYHLFDSQGLELRQGQINNIDNGYWQINLFDTPNGIYYLQIEDLTFKLVKEV